MLNLYYVRLYFDEFWQRFVEGGVVAASLVTATACGGAYCAYFLMSTNYFKAQGIPGPRPWPIFGNMLPALMKGRIQSDMDDIKKYGRILGTFTGLKPTLVVADPDMLQMVMVKHFSTFINRPIFGSGDVIFDNTLMALCDSKWRFVRHALAPTFSAVKLKQMHQKVNRCAQLLINNLQRECANKQLFEIKKYTGDFTMDVIASTAFGLQVDSQTETDNQFVVHARNAFAALRITNPVILMMIFTPWLLPLLRLFRITAIPKSSTAFFVAVVDQAMKERQKESSGGHVDLLQLMINAHREEKEDEGVSSPGDDSYEYWKQRGMTRDLIAAQAFIFFLAGYDTTASTLAFLCYELALNPDCQRHLQAEVDTVVADDDDVDSDVLAKLSYMEMCIQETLRKYPPIPRMTRLASHDITLNGVHLKKGTRVAIPIYAIHHDPEFWPDPEQFDPQRFTAEAKSQHRPFTHIPFALGPRNCIGMRLALVEAKIAMVHVLRRFNIVTCEQTQIPLKFSRKALLTAENGIFLKLETRTSASL